jgi:hypothetical protein
MGLDTKETKTQKIQLSISSVVRIWGEEVQLDQNLATLASMNRPSTPILPYFEKMVAISFLGANYLESCQSRVPVCADLYQNGSTI